MNDTTESRDHVSAALYGLRVEFVSNGYIVRKIRLNAEFGVDHSAVFNDIDGVLEEIETELKGRQPRPADVEPEDFNPDITEPVPTPGFGLGGALPGDPLGSCSADTTESDAASNIYEDAVRAKQAAFDADYRSNGSIASSETKE